MGQILNVSMESTNLPAMGGWEWGYKKTQILPQNQQEKTCGHKLLGDMKEGVGLSCGDRKDLWKPHVMKELTFECKV